jgi:hypothetical protein
MVTKVRLGVDGFCAIQMPYQEKTSASASEKLCPASDNNAKEMGKVARDCSANDESGGDA